MSTPNDLLQSLEHLSAPQMRRLLTEHLTRQKLGLYWESSAIERDAALNAISLRTAGSKRYDFPMRAVVTTPGGFHAQPT